MEPVCEHVSILLQNEWDKNEWLQRNSSTTNSNKSCILVTVFFCCWKCETGGEKERGEESERDRGLKKKLFILQTHILLHNEKRTKREWMIAEHRSDKLGFVCRVVVLIVKYHDGLKSNRWAKHQTGSKWTLWTLDHLLNCDWWPFYVTSRKRARVHFLHLPTHSVNVRHFFHCSLCSTSTLITCSVSPQLAPLPSHSFVEIDVESKFFSRLFFVALSLGFIFIEPWPNVKRDNSEMEVYLWTTSFMRQLLVDT